MAKKRSGTVRRVTSKAGPEAATLNRLQKLAAEHEQKKQKEEAARKRKIKQHEHTHKGEVGLQYKGSESAQTAKAEAAERKHQQQLEIMRTRAELKKGQPSRTVQYKGKSQPAKLLSKTFHSSHPQKVLIAEWFVSTGLVLIDPMFDPKNTKGYSDLEFWKQFWAIQLMFAILAFSAGLGNDVGRVSSGIGGLVTMTIAFTKSAAIARMVKALAPEKLKRIPVSGTHVGNPHAPSLNVPQTNGSRK